MQEGEEPSRPEDDAHESNKPTDLSETAAVDITAGALPHGHYDPKNDVILKLECMRAWEVRVIILPEQAALDSASNSLICPAWGLGLAHSVDGSTTAQESISSSCTC